MITWKNQQLVFFNTTEIITILGEVAFVFGGGWELQWHVDKHVSLSRGHLLLHYQSLWSGTNMLVLVLSLSRGHLFLHYQSLWSRTNMIGGGGGVKFVLCKSLLLLVGGEEFVSDQCVVGIVCKCWCVRALHVLRWYNLHEVLHCTSCKQCWDSKVSCNEVTRNSFFTFHIYHPVHLKGGELSF